MKKKLFLVMTMLSFTVHSQENKLLIELSESACKCVDSINTYNRIKDSISSDINKCITKAALAYQLGEKIKDIDTTKTKNVTIDIYTNENSKEYKKYYYEVENYMTDNCGSVKRKLAINDVVKKNSFSENEMALKYYNIGSEASERGDYEEAIKYYKLAIKEDPKFVFAYDNLGYAYRKLEKFDDAVEYYKKSLKIDPEGLMPLQNIAIAYKLKKDYTNAIKWYEKLTKVDSNNPEAFYGISLIQIETKEYEKALDNICQAYILYVNQKSAYRTDTEKLISMLYVELKEQGKLDIFNKTLEKYHIKQN